MNRLVRIACFPARLVRSWRDAKAVIADAEHGPDDLGYGQVRDMLDGRQP